MDLMIKENVAAINTYNNICNEKNVFQVKL